MILKREEERRKRKRNIDVREKQLGYLPYMPHPNPTGD